MNLTCYIFKFKAAGQTPLHSGPTDAEVPVGYQRVCGREAAKYPGLGLRREPQAGHRRAVGAMAVKVGSRGGVWT